VAASLRNAELRGGGVHRLCASSASTSKRLVSFITWTWSSTQACAVRSWGVVRTLALRCGTGIWRLAMATIGAAAAKKQCQTLLQRNRSLSMSSLHHPARATGVLGRAWRDSRRLFPHCKASILCVPGEHSDAVIAAAIPLVLAAPRENMRQE